MPAPIIPATPDAIQRATDILRHGGLVAMPTETVYGLACDASNAEAVARLYAAKGRPRFNPLIAHVSSIAMAEREAILNARAAALTRHFWPGALTVILPAHPTGTVSDLARAGLETLALRQPAHPVARSLISEFGGPLVAPSANRSGHVSPTRPEHVAADLGDKIDLIIDGGACEKGVESTIVSLMQDTAELLRPGAIDTHSLASFLGGDLSRRSGHDHAINAPGQLKSHYAPNATIRLNADNALADEVYLGFGHGPEGPNLSMTGDLNEAAANLFSMLRKLDEQFDKIAIAPIPDTGLGEAINDRLLRAAHRD